ncbi:hypothetical protein N1851_028593 [Merluccius polli]|uniref:Uncharacterized protein n=1 Tax=Merluccius polli TaxID=89951 RepID=A0AA47M8F0_MERPO|nr:hypothetical protein N1851_028593 [Merluccius polli]
MSERQAQVQQAQNEVLLELGQALTADRAVLQELLRTGYGECGALATAKGREPGDSFWGDGQSIYVDF